MNNTTSITDDPESFKSDLILIIKSMGILWALVFVICIIAHCIQHVSRVSQPTSQESTNNGINEKIIEVIPKYTYDSNTEYKGFGMLCSSECAICLSEYVDGEEIRVLPECRHVFHVGCIDAWLSSNSSCPSCRKILATSRRKEW
ncbi:zinc finger, RING/FYVE/PHD-type containing protein [Tanacetum coccineum]